MIDCDHNITSHYEYVAEKRAPVSNAMKVKKKAFKAMEQLDGWCSNEKAGILIDLILKIKPETIVEIGVYGGKSLVPMAFALKENKKGKIYGIDPWEATESIVGMDGANFDWWSKLDHGLILQRLVNNITDFDLWDYIKLIKNTSADAEPIANIDILHIDGNHSEETSCIDATKWVPLVKKGGYIVFDDITWDSNGNGTGKAVDWVNQHCTKFATYSGDNDWGIWIKK